jgi:colanic acid/amylovoran biosynthesis glycosyltransferase
VCRFVEKKGLEYAIRGVGQALERMPDAPIRFELIGSGPLEEPLADLGRDLGLEDRVLFSGALPHKDVVSALERSDALILPSVVSSDGDMEGIPLSLMEAMASGVSVISTYHSGIPELIEHGVSGLLSEERNVDQVADNILKLLQNPEDAAKMAQQARLVIESKFNSDMLNDQLEKLCREAADRSQPAAEPGA